MSSKYLLTCSNVEKKYISGSEKLEVLQNITFSASNGEKIIITGESGSGKSTLLNLIGGLDKVTSGSINVSGFAVSELPEDELTQYRRNIFGYIFQFHYLLRDFTAAENVMLPAFIGGIKKKDAERKAEELLKQVGLEDRADHYPFELSGGERQRVAVARALINEPEVILADEPTGNLDESNSRVIEDMLFQLVDDLGKTLILVTHDMGIVKKGHRHLQLEKGKITEG